MNKLNKTFKINPLYETDMYKIGHKLMLAIYTTFLYATWIPRKLKFMPKGITKIMSAGQQFTVRWLHSNFQENFFDQPIEVAEKFVSDMSKSLSMEYTGEHFLDLHRLGYLPIKVKSLPEGIETDANIPHMTFVNTVEGYGWLTLFLETYISKLAWRLPTVVSIAKQYRRVAESWVEKTDPDRKFLVDYMCHDFSSRGGSPFDSIAVGLAHTLVFKGSDTLNAIPAARYFYDHPEDEVCLESVNASEHSVSCTKIFTVGEQNMITDWLQQFPKGILSIVSDTFDLWKLITEYLPANKEAIMARDGKLVIRPDSGDPVDIICGSILHEDRELYDLIGCTWEASAKGVIELLWDTFGGTINEQGYKVLDSHIGAIYGDSINLERQEQIYERLAAKGFAATNIVLGVGSYQYIGSITRDSAGYAAKASWFEVEKEELSPNGDGTFFPHKIKTAYNIYKDPVTDDGTKKSLKGLMSVHDIGDINTGGSKIVCREECTKEEEEQGLLQIIYQDGQFFNQTTLTEIRERINNL